MNSLSLTRQSKKLLSLILKKSGPFRAVDLTKDSGMNQRSVRYALKILEEKELVEKIPDLGDLRSNIYFLNVKNKQIVKSLLN